MVKSAINIRLKDFKLGRRMFMTVIRRPAYAALLSALAIMMPLQAAMAETGDDKCIPLYQSAGAVPQTPSCKSKAAFASVNLGTRYCTSEPNIIERYCGGTAEPQQCNAQAGQQSGAPIIASRAEKYRSETDWTDTGPSPLQISRTYRSTWMWEPARSNGVLGQVWTHNYSVSLQTFPATSPTQVLITTAEGYLRPFTKASGSSTWTAANSADTLTQDASGSWTYKRSTDDATMQFDAAGKLTSITNRGGQVTALAYNSAGQLLSVTNPFGRVLGFGYTGNRLTSVTTPDGRTLGYTYDSTNRLSTVVYPDNSHRTFVYENTSFPQALTGIVDESGGRWGTFTYDTIGRAISTQLAGGANSYQVSYPASEQALVVDPLGTSRLFKYKSNKGKLAVVSGSLPSNGNDADAFSRVQDTNGFITSETDFKGVTKTTSWDSARRLPLSIVEASATADAKTTTYTWHPVFDLPATITETGRVTSFAYDTAGNLLSRTITDTQVTPNVARTWAYTYNPQQLVETQTQPNGAVTTYAYDTLGNVLSATDALGRISSFGYDNAGRIETSTAPNGLVTSYTWDSRDRLLSHKVGSLPATVMTYNPTGTLATLTQPSGLAYSYSYDGAHRLTGWSSNRGVSGSFALDPLGNRLSEEIKDASGQAAWVSAQTVNSLNRVESETIGLNQSTSLTYDANGDLATETNGLNQTTTLEVDRLRRLSKITDPLNHSASISYNQLGDISQAKDFKSVATTYTRDALGNVRQEGSPDAGTSTSTYDASGLLASTTDATGRTIGMDRDALGRITEIHYNDGTSSVLRYDLVGAPYNTASAPNASIGQLSEIQDPGVTTQFQRDTLGRVLRKTQILASGTTVSVAYTYVPAGQGGAGNVQAITYPSGKQLSYQYSASGQITGMQWNGVPLIANLLWNPLGMPTDWTWSSIASAVGSSTKLAEVRRYKTAGQLTHSSILDLVWNQGGRVSAVEQSHMVPGSAAGQAPQSARIASAYSYDDVGRMTASAHSLVATPSITWPGAGASALGLLDVTGYNSMGYAYDANGNRASASIVKTTGSNTTSTTTKVYSLSATNNVLNSVLSTTNLGAISESLAYQYDASGSIVSAVGAGEHYLHYGANGRIAKVTTASASSTDPNAVSYLYNSASQRLLKTDARQSATSPRTEYAIYSEEDSSQLLGVYSNERSANSAAAAGEMDSTEVIYLPTAQGLLPIATQINGRLYAIHSDHLNTPRRLTNADGQVSWQWLVTGFGEVNPTTGAEGYVQMDSAAAGTLASYAPEVTFNLRYPGQQWDEETGLAFNVNRYYNSQDGRYWSAPRI
jgi:YD repeat-containing protein